MATLHTEAQRGMQFPLTDPNNSNSFDLRLVFFLGADDHNRGKGAICRPPNECSYERNGLGARNVYTLTFAEMQRSVGYLGSWAIRWRPPVQTAAGTRCTRTCGRQLVGCRYCLGVHRQNQRQQQRAQNFSCPPPTVLPFSVTISSSAEFPGISQFSTNNFFP